jgi:hypothetical protein
MNDDFKKQLKWWAILDWLLILLALLMPIGVLAFLHFVIEGGTI